MKNKFWQFVKTYKTPILVLILVWVTVLVLQHYFVEPINSENKRLKQTNKGLETKNKAILERVASDSLKIDAMTTRINDLEKLEQFYKNQIPKIQIKYEKVKTDYIALPLRQRRDEFARLANEK